MNKPPTIESPSTRLLDDAPIVVVQLDRDFRRVYVNRAAVALTGRRAEELLGRTLAEAGTPAALLGFWHEAIGRVFETGVGTTLEFDYPSLDGRLHTLNTRVVPEPAADGTVPTVTCYSLEVTSTREIERERTARVAAEHFKAMVDGALDAVMVTDDDRVYVEVNAAACALYGLSREQLLGRRLDDFIDPEAKVDVPAVWQAFMAAGEQSGELPLRRPDGTVRWVEYRARARYVPGRHVSMLRDVTQQRETTRALAVERRRLEATLQQMPSGVAIADATTGRIVMTNQRAEALWHHALPPLDDPNAYEHWRIRDGDGRTLASDERPLARALRGETVTRSVSAVETPEGTRTYAASAAPVRDEQGTITGAVCVFDDVTDTTRAADEREEMLRMQERFMAILGHDLRDPLNAILGTATLLTRQAALDERTRKSVARIASSATRATRMVAQLLDVSRVRPGGALPVTLTECDLAVIARNTVEELTGNRPDAPVEVRTEGPTTGMFDPDRVAQLVGNLVGNATRYGAPGKPVALIVRGTEKAVSVTVRNEGEPIPKSVAETLFEPFHRGHTEGKGLGLGLYICRQITLAHHGDITVRSSQEEGTLFTAVLPRKAAGAGM